MKKLIVITGQTGAGKTSLSLQIASHLKRAEIISADSKQVYKEMNIGTDKIDDMQGIPHHLLNLVEPDQTFTVADFKKRARQKIKDIQQKNKVPILCGGSYFYIKAVVDGLVLPQVAPDWNFRKKKNKLSEQKLFEELKDKDPRRAKSIDKHNKRRLVRALEIIEKTGKPVPELNKEPLNYPILMLALKIEKEELHRRIDKRVDKMVNKGLKDEARKLLNNYNRTPLETIGYKEWEPHFKEEKSENQVIEEIKTNTKQFSKKQKNWLKKDDRLIWVETFKEAKERVGSYIKN